MDLVDVKKVEPGRVYCVEVDQRLSADLAEHIVEQWKLLATDSRLLILDGGMKIEELTPEQVRDMISRVPAEDLKDLGLKLDV